MRPPSLFNTRLPHVLQLFLMLNLWYQQHNTHSGSPTPLSDIINTTSSNPERKNNYSGIITWKIFNYGNFQLWKIFDYGKFSIIMIHGKVSRISLFIIVTYPPIINGNGWSILEYYLNFDHAHSLKSTRDLKSHDSVKRSIQSVTLISLVDSSSLAII